MCECELSKCVNDLFANVPSLIVLSITISSGRIRDDVCVVRMAASCWRFGHLRASVFLLLLAPLADAARHSLPRTWRARTRVPSEFPPPAVSQTPSSKDKNNNKHFNVICAASYTRAAGNYRLSCVACLREQRNEIAFRFWRSNRRSPQGITLKDFHDVCSLSSRRVFHSWSDEFRRMI